MMRVYTFKAYEDQIKILEEIARLKGITRSEAIREAIELYINFNARKIKIEYKRITLNS